jgi:hypothetical protein
MRTGYLQMLPPFPITSGVCYSGGESPYNVFEVEYPLNVSERLSFAHFAVAWSAFAFQHVFERSGH